MADALLGTWNAVFSTTTRMEYHGVDEESTLPSLHALGTLLMALGAALVVLQAHHQLVAARAKE